MPRSAVRENADMKRAAVALLSSGLLLFLPAAAPASATRAEYAQQVNAICERAVTDAERVLSETGEADSGDRSKGFRRAMKLIGRALDKLVRINGRMLDRTALVPPAPGDEALVFDWIASDRRAHRLNKKYIPQLLLVFRLIFRAPLVIIVNGERITDKPTKKERRAGKKLLRAFNNMDRTLNKLLDEESRSSIMAAELGADKCGGSTSPELPDRVARSLGLPSLPAGLAARAAGPPGS